MLITLYFFYYYSISTVIPYFIEIKKIRNKKLDTNFKLITNIKNDLKFNLWSINYSYKQFIK
uniref:ATPase subunit 8 n=1 Tax=Attheya longicornis TaxID=451786 RepID=A0A8E7MIM5_9STRA|nr:ATPase subunit 8 [Attheya longicornis]